MRAAIRLMAWLFTIVAESLRRGADFSVVAHVATFVAGSSSDGRHVSGFVLRLRDSVSGEG